MISPNTFNLPALLKRVPLDMVRRNIATWWVYIFVFLTVFTFNTMTPLWGDDWWRAVDLSDLSTVFERIYAEYRGWNPRATVLLATFLGLLKYPGSDVVFNLVSSVIFVLMLVGIFRAALNRWPRNDAIDSATLLVAFFSVWYLTDSMAEAVFWKTGAVAYMWVVAGAIYLLIPYVNAVLGIVEENTIFKQRGLPVLAFLFALTLENVSLSISLFMLYCFVAVRLKGKVLPAWYYRVGVSFIVGSVILIAAPGNFKRFDSQDNGVSIYQRFPELLEKIWDHGLTVTHSFIVIFLLLVIVAVQRNALSVSLQRLQLWFTIGLMFAFAMIVSTGVNFGNRTAFCTDVIFIILVVGLFYQCVKNAKPLLVWVIPGFTLLFVFFVADTVLVFEQHLATHQNHSRRLELMRVYKDNAVNKILLPSMKIPRIKGLKDDILTERYFLRDIHGDTPGNGWRNGSYGHYYGFHFATRLESPYVIYIPELSSSYNHFFSPGQGDNWLVFNRLEKSGYQQHMVLYVMTPGIRCVRNLKVVTQEGQIGNADFRLKEMNWSSLDGTFVIDVDGSISQRYCLARIELDSFDRELARVTVESQQSNNRFSLDLVSDSWVTPIDSLPEFLQDPKLVRSDVHR